MLALLTIHLKSRSTHFDCVYSLDNILFYAFEQVEAYQFFICFALPLGCFHLGLCVREYGFLPLCFSTHRMPCRFHVRVCKWTFCTFRNAPSWQDQFEENSADSMNKICHLSEMNTQFMRATRFYLPKYYLCYIGFAVNGRMNFLINLYHAKLNLNIYQHFGIEILSTSQWISFKRVELPKYSDDEQTHAHTPEKDDYRNRKICKSTKLNTSKNKFGESVRVRVCARMNSW